MDALTQHRKQRLRALIDSPPYRGSQVEFSRAAGVSEGRISQLLDPAKSFGERSARNIANELRLGERYFEDGFATKPEDDNSPIPAANEKKPRRVPVTGAVRGGDDGYLIQDNGIDGWVDFWTQDPRAFALRIKGDSMHPRYRAGEYVIVTPSIESQPGMDVVVKMTDGKCLLKQLNWIRDDELQLVSINNRYEPMTLMRSDVECIERVAGSVGEDSLIF